MGTGEAASVAAPGALGVLNSCARGPKHLHAGNSIALASSVEMRDLKPGQAVVVAVVEVEVVAVGVVMGVEGVAGLVEGQSGQSCSLSCACLQG